MQVTVKLLICCLSLLFELVTPPYYDTLPVLVD